MPIYLYNVSGWIVYFLLPVLSYIWIETVGVNPGSIFRKKSNHFPKSIQGGIDIQSGTVRAYLDPDKITLKYYHPI